MIAQPKRKIGLMLLRAALAARSRWYHCSTAQHGVLPTARQLPPEKQLEERRHQFVNDPVVRETFWNTRTSALERTMPA